MLRILGISGSLRRGSHNTTLLRAAAELLPPGVELEVYDGLRDLPPYAADFDIDERCQQQGQGSLGRHDNEHVPQDVDERMNEFAGQVQGGDVIVEPDPLRRGVKVKTGKADI